MGRYILPRWSWLNMRTMANQKVGGWDWDFHTVRGVSCVDGFRPRHVTLSCLGNAYFVYESCPMSDRTKLTCFHFRLINSSLKYLAVKIVSAVVAYRIYKKWAIYTARNKQQHCNSIRGVE